MRVSARGARPFLFLDGLVTVSDGSFGCPTWGYPFDTTTSRPDGVIRNAATNLGPHLIMDIGSRC